MTPTPQGWRAAGTASVVALSSNLSMGVALVEALDGSTLADLRARGADLCLLIERTGASATADPQGFDLVAVTGPDPKTGPPGPRVVSYRGDAGAGRVVDLILPVGSVAAEVRPFAKLRKLFLAHEKLQRERGVAAEQEAKQRAVQRLWEGLRPALEEAEGAMYLGLETLPVRGEIPAEHAGAVLEKNHRIEDTARYGHLVEGRDEPHRTPAHPGNDHCARCHAQIADAWEITHHAFAWRNLEKVGAARSPECVTCHSTGFDPSGETGWSKMSELRGHENVGCTSCHQARETGGMPEHPWGAADGCEACHTPYASPYFQPENAFAKVDCRKVVAWLRRRQELKAKGSR